MIAQDAQALGMTQDALRGYDLVVVTEIRAAQRLVMEDGIDLFVIGIHFDDSRAVELVRFIRSDQRHKTTPIVFVRLLPTTLRDILGTTVLALIKMGTISQYLELENDPDFAVKIRDYVSSLLPLQLFDTSPRSS